MAELPLELVPRNLDGYRIVDIREECEREEEPFPLENSEWIPLSEFTGFPESAEPVLFVCHHGVRSLRLVRFLRSSGHRNVYSLPGGTETLRSILRS
ncbi:MAG TPA: rhodanese-like domain-containing protein [Fimbriimonas sp.]|nr:rhodanese-like domain-containing protein [Fimbriimonas sp.]